MENIVKITAENFEETVKKSGVVLVDFFATWCGPCKMLAPVLEDIAKANPQITVAKADVDEVNDLAMRFGIMSVPTVMIFKDGEKQEQFSGYRPQNALQSTIDKYL